VNNQAKNIDVVILCGGLGKRFRQIRSDLPKALAGIHQRTFLDILLEQIAHYGFKKAILCIGYKGQMIKDYYCGKTLPLEIIYSKETRPLGTGGALKNAKGMVNSKLFLVINGDTLTSADLNSFVAFHIRKKAVMSMLLVKSKKSARLGNVKLNGQSQIIGFEEKINRKNTGLVNAGMYLMVSGIFKLMPRRRSFSLEYDFFPRILDEKCYGFLSARRFIDIGTPQGYREAISQPHQWHLKR